MATNVYEGLFIFDPSKYASDPTGVAGQLDNLVGKHGGKMLASRLWEERRLAYPINGRKNGTYWLTYFELDSRKVAPLEGDVRLSDSIMRSMVLKVDARIADALVSHATADPKAAAAEE